MKFPNKKLYNTGFQNTIYLVNYENKLCCLRVSLRKNRAYLSYETRLLEFLELPVPKPIEIEGNYIFKVNNKHAILYEFITGTTKQNLNEKELRQVARFLARFHNQGKGFKWEGYRYKWYDLSDWKLKTYAAFARKKKVPYLHYLPRIISDLKKERLNNLPQGPIHADIGGKNIVFNKGTLAGVIDFDNSYIGPLILDLGKAIMFHCSHGGQYDYKRAKILITEYQKHRKLTEKEHKQLDKAIRFAYLSHIFVDYYMRAKGITSKEYFSYIIEELYAAYLSFKTPQRF